eukprot:scaffold5980_cov192-Amphora_coffeaeformis.AAC.2
MNRGQTIDIPHLQHAINDAGNKTRFDAWTSNAFDMTVTIQCQSTIVGVIIVVKNGLFRIDDH